MKTILYMSLTADGYFAQADQAHPIPKEILDDFRMLVVKTKSLIVGRGTYDLSRRTASGGFAGINVVVVSGSPFQTEGVCVVPSPQEALQHLGWKGCDIALVGGGAQLDSSFLSLRLVDEIYLNIEPVIAGKGITLNAVPGHETPLRLIGTSELGGGVIQMHYVCAA